MQEKLLFRITRTSPIVNHNYCNPLHFSCSLFFTFFLFIHLKYDWKVMNIYNNNKKQKSLLKMKAEGKRKKQKFLLFFCFFCLVFSSSTVYIFIVIWHSFLLHFFFVAAFYNSPLTSIFVSAISLAKTNFFLFFHKARHRLTNFYLNVKPCRESQVQIKKKNNNSNGRKHIYNTIHMLHRQVVKCFAILKYGTHDLLALRMINFIENGVQFLVIQILWSSETLRLTRTMKNCEARREFWLGFFVNSKFFLPWIFPYDLFFEISFFENFWQRRRHKY